MCDEVDDKNPIWALKVKDLIKHLERFDPDGYVLVAEMNAFDGGMWQHTPVENLKRYIRSVEDEKHEYSHDRKYIEKEFIYAKDNDVIVRF